MDNKKIGSFISELRREKQMTQQDLSKLLGVTNKAISKWECGEGYPEITIVPALAECLGVTVDELLSGERREGKNSSMATETNLPRNYGISLLENARHKFDNQFMIAMALVAVGVIAFFTITLTSLFEVIGFGTALIFYIISGILFYMSSSQLLLAGKRHEELAGDNSQHQELRELIFKRLITGVWTWMIAVFLLLPYLLLDQPHFPRSIITFSTYLLSLPLSLTICAGLTYFLVLWLQKTYYIRWELVVNEDLPSTLPASQKRYIRDHNMAAAILWAAWLGIFWGLNLVFSKPDISYSSVIYGTMTIGLIAGNIAILFLYLLKDKSTFYRGWLICSGARNLFSGFFVVGGIMGSVSYYSNYAQVGWNRYLDYTPVLKGFTTAALIFAAITAVMYIIKSGLLKKSKPVS